MLRVNFARDSPVILGFLKVKNLFVEDSSIRQSKAQRTGCTPNPRRPCGSPPPSPAISSTCDPGSRWPWKGAANWEGAAPPPASKAPPPKKGALDRYK